MNRNRWTISEINELEKIYDAYPFILPVHLVERHGKAGCYTKAENLGFSRKFKKGVPEVENWSETTSAYLAGIIDGEGTITICKGNRYAKRTGREYYYYRPVVTIANTSYDLLAYLETLGIGGTSYDLRKQKAHWKQAFQWCLSSVNAVYVVLKAIYPYLVIKKEKAAEVMRWIEENKYNIKKAA